MKVKVTSPRTVKLLGLAGLAGLIFLSWVFVLSPRLGEAGAIRDQANTVELNNKALAAAVAGLKVKQGNLDQERAQEAALATRMPADAAQAALFTAIKAAASRAGIDESNLSSVVPSVPQWHAATGTAVGRAVPGSLATMSLDITISGSYTQMTKFITELENMPRSYLINTITLTPVVNAGDKYTMSISGLMFVLAPPVDPQPAASK